MIGNGSLFNLNALDTGSLASTRWTDKSFPATLAKQGANTKPDYDFTNLGLLFPQNDPSEIVYINDQMDHRKKLGTSIYLHIHFIQTSALVPVFKADYKFYNNGTTPPVSFTNISTTEVVFPYVSGSILQIIRFPVITAPTNEGLSANLDLKIYRQDNVVTGDVLVKFIDYHFEMDDDGSQQELAK